MNTFLNFEHQLMEIFNTKINQSIRKYQALCEPRDHIIYESLNDMILRTLKSLITNVIYIQLDIVNKRGYKIKQLEYCKRTINMYFLDQIVFTRDYCPSWAVKPFTNSQSESKKSNTQQQSRSSRSINLIPRAPWVCHTRVRKLIEEHQTFTTKKSSYKLCKLQSTANLLSAKYDFKYLLHLMFYIHENDAK